MLSEKLTKEFGKGFSETNLEQMRKFFKVYGIPQTLSEEFKNKEKMNCIQNLRYKIGNTLFS